MNKKYQYTQFEEKIHTLTHIPGIILGLVILIFFIIKSSLSVSAFSFIGEFIYGFSFFILFCASSAYHYSTDLQKKLLLKKIDHSCIFLFMAGCYTPFILNNMTVDWKYFFLAFVWMIAIAGVFYKFKLKQKNIFFSVSLYMIFAYMCFLAKKDLLDMIPAQAFKNLLIGGIFYTIGAFFYVLKKVKYHHAIWHILVIIGAAFHFMAVYQSKS